MTRFRDHLLLLPALLGLAVVLAAGCGSDDSPTPPPVVLDEAFADDIAQHFGNVLATDPGGTVLSLTAPAATIPASVATLLARGARPAGLGTTARDTSFTVGGITWTIVDTFYTAGGVPEPDVTPASVRVSVRSFGNGTLALAGAGGLYRHRGHLAAVGLSATQDTLRFDGTGRDSSKTWFTGRFSGVPRRMLCVADIAWEAVFVLKGQAPDAPPVEGFAVCTVTASRFGSADTTQVERQAPVTVLLGFDGSETFFMNVGTLYEYQADLRTGVIGKLPAGSFASRVRR